MLFLRLILSDPDRIQRLFTISNCTIRLVSPQTDTCTNASRNGDRFPEGSWREALWWGETCSEAAARSERLQLKRARRYNHWLFSSAPEIWRFPERWKINWNQPQKCEVSHCVCTKNEPNIQLNQSLLHFDCWHFSSITAGLFSQKGQLWSRDAEMLLLSRASFI